MRQKASNMLLKHDDRKKGIFEINQKIFFQKIQI